MIEPTFTNNYDDTYTVSSTCACGSTTTARVPGPSVFAWRQGAFVQTAFPMLSNDEREALFVSGTCGECWERMFPQEEDDVYWSGTGELMNDDSYIDYLNRW
jgi:hypothetical protein